MRLLDLPSTRIRATYHPQLWVDVWQAQDPWVYDDIDIPPSTRQYWRVTPPPEIVGAELFAASNAEVRRECDALKRRIPVLLAVVRLLVTLLRVQGADLRSHRLPDGRDKARILRAVERAATVLGLAAALRVVGLSASRYHEWQARTVCLLDDQPSCPRSSPHRLRFQELRDLGDLVCSGAHRHFSVRALALHAQRLGKVFACSGTWYRLMQRHGWRRPRVERLYRYPEDGVRADAPNRIWHVDQTLLRLTDGTRVYVQAIIDNFSRFVLAWDVSLECGGAFTADLLHRAARHLRPGDALPVLWSDSGSENVNHVVHDVLSSHSLKHVLAQIDIRFSNSMIERFFYALKHRCLYLERLTSVVKVRELVGWFVNQHNCVMPHAAFHGQTPVEMFLGTGAHIPGELRARHHEARRARLEQNRRASCGACPQLTANASAGPDPPA